jgi:pimeloyl-ACP methyl ester carboxylesterase
MKDKFVGAKYLQKFKSGFPNCRIQEFESCGHFPQEERADETAQSIFNFLSQS